MLHGINVRVRLGTADVGEAGRAWFVSPGTATVCENVAGIASGTTPLLDGPRSVESQDITLSLPPVGPHWVCAGRTGPRGAAAGDQQATPTRMLQDLDIEAIETRHPPPIRDRHACVTHMSTVRPLSSAVFTSAPAVSSLQQMSALATPINGVLPLYDSLFESAPAASSISTMTVCPAREATASGVLPVNPEVRALTSMLRLSSRRTVGRSPQSMLPRIEMPAHVRLRVVALPASGGR